MKTKLLLIAFVATFIIHTSAFAQGALTPPGAPAPTMKSLDQVEARTPLVAGQAGVSVAADGAITITQPGSYYLTQNLTITDTADGINVGSNSATIDLNGFIISGTVGHVPNVGIGIMGITGQSVTIRNGHIVGGGTNAGFFYAIGIQQVIQGNILVENVHVRDVRHSGIRLTVGEARNIVRNCSVENAFGGYGIVADVVTGCTVRETKLDGIQAAIVSDCTVIQNWGTGDAIDTMSAAGINGLVINSKGQSYAGYGIRGQNVSNSFGSSTTGDTGIYAGGTANICTGECSGGTAINAHIAIGCTSTAGTIIAFQKFLGTP